VGVRVGVAYFLDQSIGIDETNTFQLKFVIYNENCERHRLGRFVGVGVGVPYSRNKLAILRSHFSIFVGVANFFWVNR